MYGGRIVYRGSGAFSGATQEAVEILERIGRSAAAREFHEALRDISRRPEPDVTGAIQQCMCRDGSDGAGCHGGLVRLRGTCKTP